MLKSSNFFGFWICLLVVCCTPGVCELVAGDTHLLAAHVVVIQVPWGEAEWCGIQLEVAG